MSRILRGTLKILAWTGVGIVLLLLLLAVLIQVPAVQDYAKDKAVNYLHSKIGTPIRIGHLSIRFPKKIVLEDIYFEDQQKDTLLAGKRLEIDISMYQLLHKQVEINDLVLSDIRAKIYRQGKDSGFNYAYIVNAFTSPSQKPQTSDTNGFKINIHHLKFDKILASFQDDIAGSNYYVYLGDFETKIKTFDLDHLNFEVSSFSLQHSIVRMYQHKPLLEAKTDSSIAAKNTGNPSVQLKLGKLDLKDIALDYGDDIAAMNARIELGELGIDMDHMDLPNLKIGVKNLILRNTDAVISLGNSPEARMVEQQVSASAKAQVSNPWQLSIANLDFSNNHIRFDNNQRARVPKGIDYAHLNVQGLHAEASNLNFTPEAFSGNIRELSLKEQCGLDLIQAHTSFLYGPYGVQLKNLLLETDKSLIQDNIELAWPEMTLTDLANHPGNMLLRINLTHSRIAVQDVLTFVPELSGLPPFYHNDSAVFAINTKLLGAIKDLNIPLFEASGLSNTKVNVNGRIQGLPDAAKTIYNLRINQFHTTNQDLGNFIPPATIASIRIPETLSATGFFNGSMNTFHTQLTITSSRGNAAISGAMSPSERYSVKAGLLGLDLGYILKEEKNVGKLSGIVKADGSGYDPKTMVADIKLNISAAYAAGYNYQFLNASAHFNHGTIDAKANMHDPALNFSLDSRAIMKGSYPAIKADIQLDSMNLQALHLYAGELKFHGHLAADFSSTNPDDLIGKAAISDLIISNAGKRYASADTIHLLTTSESDHHVINLDAPGIHLNLDGTYMLTEIAQTLEHTLNRYYNIPGFKETRTRAQTWTLKANVHPGPFLFTFAPELKGSDSINAQVDYSSATDDLRLSADAPTLVAGTIHIDSLKINASTANSLLYSISLQDAGNGQYQLNHTSISGDISNNQVHTILDIKDPGNKSRYQLAAHLNQSPGNGIKLELDPALMLDYNTWTVSPDHFILYDKAGLVVHHFSMSYGSQMIAVSSSSDEANAPIDLQFQNFQIGTITRIAEQDSLLVDGLINGKAQIKNPTGNLIFTSDLQVKDLSYLKDTVGDLSLKVNNETSQTLSANIQLQGHGNDIRVNGRYVINSGQMDMDLNLANVAVASLIPFTAGQLQNADGNLKGQLSIKGSLDKPNLQGEIRFDSAHMTPTLLGERFGLTNDAIQVNATGIHFNQFIIADSSNNQAKINGDLITSDYRNYRFGLNISADHFQAVNSSRKTSGQAFYGKLNLSTQTKIAGDMNLPVVTGSLHINKNTDFSYVLPSSDPEVQSREGVVRFVDMKAPLDTSIFARTSDSAKNQSGFKGVDLSARIESDSSAKFNIVIDERNGDAIHIRGTAALEAAVDRSGKVSLTGTYVMQDGSYLLTLNFLKRQFHIKSGSTITWDGDPTHATVDITAIYIANTAPIDLVDQQLSGRSEYEINQYKQRIPFNVLLQMKGELLKPQISFDIQLQERDADRLKDVDAKLQQVRSDESELNKQVFALLLLGHFVNENPLASEGTPTTAESFARESASRILTDQLNKLAGNLIKGVDVNFGVTSGSDYSTGELAQRTDLTVGVSKKLLNDRLKVNVGSTFGLEGPTAPNQQASNIAGDVSLDYQLTKDGRYVIRAYRRNDYEGLIEGQVIETGATFIFKIDYDKFNDFFRKPKRRDTNP